MITQTIVAAAVRMFDATPIADEVADDIPILERLALIGAILNQRDDKHRVAYTATQVEACRIGLERYRGSSPEADAMLKRLEESVRHALTWPLIVERREKGVPIRHSRKRRQ